VQGGGGNALVRRTAARTLSVHGRPRRRTEMAKRPGQKS